MARPLIECVPNISEGRDKAKIEAIARVAETVEGVRLLDVDPGATTNRTVITFVGEPEPVKQAAALQWWPMKYAACRLKWPMLPSRSAAS